MRILLLTQILPYPPDSGPKVKTYNLLRYLATNHEVTLVSLVRSAAEAEQAAALRGLCTEVHTVLLRRSKIRDLFYLAQSMLTNSSFIIARDASPELTSLLAELTSRNQYDVIHADQLNMAQFALNLPGRMRVLDEHNAVWTIVQRMAQQSASLPRRAFLDIEAQRLRRYEAEVCSRFDGVLAVSEPDRWALELAASTHGTTLAPCTIVPIAVDCADQEPVTRAIEPDTILSMATMFWPPNVDGVLWFAREVYPLIKRQVQGARFAVVGARPPRSVTGLSESDPGIEVTGYVDDPLPYLARSAALIVPVRAGGGMRVKILEALARGIPIVSTTIGYEGIELTPGEHLLVGDTPEDFAAAVVRLLNDPALGRKLAAAGRKLAEQRYDWRVVNPAIEDLYAKAGYKEAGVIVDG